MNENAVRLGAILKKERTVRGYSLRKFAAICGVSFGHLDHIERGHFGVSLTTFVLICRGLKIQPAALLEDILLQEKAATTKGAA